MEPNAQRFCEVEGIGWTSVRMDTVAIGGEQEYGRSDLIGVLLWQLTFSGPDQSL